MQSVGRGNCGAKVDKEQKKYYTQVLLKKGQTMHVTTKGQVTIPRDVRESMGIIPAKTEIEFLQDEQGRWYISKAKPTQKTTSRFRTAHQSGKLTMSTDEIMALTRE